MMVISYFTDNGTYREEYRLLEASLQRAGMPHDGRVEKDRGDWYANTRYKPRFIQTMRKTHDGPLLYIDADAFVHENCEAYFDGLAERGVDFGAHWFQGPAKGHRRSEVRAEGWWMLSGTMFFGDTVEARRLIDTWCYLNDILFQQGGVAEGGGQKNLWFLTTCMTDLVIERLPGRYCYVFDKPWAYPKDEPYVIEHTIASRDHRSGTRRKTRTRGRRIAQLKEAIESGVAAPHPQRGAHERTLLSRLEKAEERRHEAGRRIRDAKHEYKTALIEERAAQEELENR